MLLSPPPAVTSAVTTPPVRLGLGGAYAGGGVAGAVVVVLQLCDGTQHRVVQANGNTSVQLSWMHGHVVRGGVVWGGVATVRIPYRDIATVHH